MTTFVVDSSAWIEYLSGTKKGEIVKKYFEENELLTPAVCVSEVIAKMLRDGFSDEIPLLAMPSRSEIIATDLTIATEAGRLYFALRKKKGKISLSDTICLATAKKYSAKILTFDTDFEGIPEAILLADKNNKNNKTTIM